MSQSSDADILIYNEVLQIPDAERAAFLDRACGGDVAQRERLDELLSLHNDAGSFFDHLERDLDVSAILPTEKPGDWIGRYKVLQQIGEGGCGVVYMAEQEAPLHRQVALKIIKLGMDTKQVVARFELERQALALMDHPNIARVLDAGATSTGRPFFVMEIVRGIKITDFCEQNRLSIPDRLKLFVEVCRAIQHAHQKGVIHRDIKPSNILVTVDVGQAGRGCPKVIDFGIAKATQGRLTDHTLFTAVEQFMGTPAYMSPEQTQMGNADIDTRADIYSLGVLLYELLTGQTPFDRRRLLAAGLDELRRTIREEDPLPPSVRLRGLAHDELVAAASDRRVEPSKLIHLVRGDLEWIVMKALEKDRARRYETATGLALDIERHMRNQPVFARPPSRVDWCRKLVRRNRSTLTLAGAIIVALVLGVCLSNWLGGKRPSVAASLDKMATQFRTQGKLPEAEALYREALAARRKFLGNVHPDVLASLNHLAAVLDDENKVDQAEAAYREALTLTWKLQGHSHHDTAGSLDNLAHVLEQERKLPEAETLYGESLAIRKKSPGNAQPEVINSVANVARILEAQGKVAEVEQFLCDWLNPATEIQPQYVDLLRIRGESRGWRGNFAGAAADLARVLQAYPNEDAVSHYLAAALVQSGQIDAYREHCRKSLAHFKETQNPVTAERISKDCLILPTSGADLVLVSELADQAVRAGQDKGYAGLLPWFQFAKGLAEYRQGHFADAAELIQKVENSGEPHRDVQAWAVLAMAQFQTKFPNDARATLAKADHLAVTKLARLDSTNPGGAWWADWVIAHALLNEAHAMVGVPTADD